MAKAFSQSAADIAADIGAGRRDARSHVEEALERIGEGNRVLNAFTDVVAGRARETAAAIDAQIAAGQPAGTLAGVPFAAKNLFDVSGLSTRAGAMIERGTPPAATDAFVIRKLESAGAVLVGALNMGEYAYDFTGENEHDGPSRNPRDPERMSGGSSGGSATAVAGGFVPIALGSDTNGSIRVPASLCGIFGLKPTFGRLSRSGTFPFVASLDHIGPLTRNVRDLALAYEAMQGFDPSDPACRDRPVEPVLQGLDQPISGLRIAVAGGYFASGLMPEASTAVSRVAAAIGARGTVILPEAHRARAAAYVITAAEGAALHLDRLRRRAADFDPAVRDRLIAGAMIPAPAVVNAQKLRQWFRNTVRRLFEDVDVIVAPATPCTAPMLGQSTFTLEGRELPVRPNLGLFTQPISFIGLPVVAVPVPLEPLPIGVQIITAPWREDLALRVAADLERRGVVAA